MKYEGVSFNDAWVRTKTLSQFIDHELHHFKGDPKATDKLTEAYNLITGAGEKKAKGKKPATPAPAEYFGDGSE